MTRRLFTLRLLFIAPLLLPSVHGQEKLTSPDSEIYTVRQFAITGSRPVSFSVRYPKNWVKTDFTHDHHADGTLSSEESPVICIFGPKRESIPESIPSNLPAIQDGVRPSISADLPSIMIQRGSRQPAKDAAQATANSYRKYFPQCREKSFLPIETKSGAHGYLVEFEAKANAQLISEIFFNEGPKGSIQISIITKPEDTVLLENLKKLILESLRF